MHSTVLAVGTPFLVVGVTFAVVGDAAIGTTFLALGTVFFALGLAIDEDGDEPDGRDERSETPGESDERV
jgi:hypothetical protein